MSGGHLITIRVVTKPCPTCRITIMVGIEQGLPARAELPALDQAGEIAALLAGARTYTLTPATRILIHRDASRIRGGYLKGTIHAEHLCPGRAK